METFRIRRTATLTISTEGPRLETRKLQDLIELELDSCLAETLKKTGKSAVATDQQNDPLVSLEALALTSPHGTTALKAWDVDDINQSDEAQHSSSQKTSREQVDLREEVSSQRRRSLEEIAQLHMNVEPHYELDIALPNNVEPQVLDRSTLPQKHDSLTPKHFSAGSSSSTGTQSNQSRQSRSNSVPTKPRRSKPARHGGIYSLLLRNTANNASEHHAEEITNIEKKGRAPVSRSATTKSSKSPSYPHQSRIRHGGIYRALMKTSEKHDDNHPNQ